MNLWRYARVAINATIVEFYFQHLDRVIVTDCADIARVNRLSDYLHFPIPQSEK